MDNIPFPNILRELLEQHGKNQRWLAIEANTTEATISRYLSGQNKPEINIIIDIAKAFDVSVDYLCGLTDLQTPKESLGSEFIQLMRCYERASERDKKILWTVLEGYMTDSEKGKLITIKEENI